MHLDRLYSIDWRKLKHTAYAALDAIARDPANNRPAQFVASVAVLFLALCNRFKLDPRKVLEVTERMVRAARDGIGATEVRAIDEYMKGELSDD